MTSRVEHRLLVRQDNADERLTPYAVQLGLVGEQQAAAVTAKYARVAAATRQLETQRAQGQTGDAWLRRPEFSLEDVEALGIQVDGLTAEEREALQIRVKYAGYIERTERQLRAEAHAQGLSLEGVDYSRVAALSNEARETLARLQPQTVAQAGRISGVRHADISALLVHLKEQRVSRET